DDRGAFLADVLRAAQQPRGRPREGVLRGVLDQRAADVLVAVVDVDVGGAGAIGGARDHVDQLPRLHVRTDPDRQLGIALNAVLGDYSSSCHTSSRRIGIACPSFVIPSTESCGPPTMKSVWTVETFIFSSGSPSKTSGTPKP